MYCKAVIGKVSSTGSYHVNSWCPEFCYTQQRKQPLWFSLVVGSPLGDQNGDCINSFVEHPTNDLVVKHGSPQASPAIICLEYFAAWLVRDPRERLKAVTDALVHGVRMEKH